MGLLRKQIGNITVKQRRESFIVHCETFDGDIPDPEFDNTDLFDLIQALIEFWADLNPEGA